MGGSFNDASYAVFLPVVLLGGWNPGGSRMEADSLKSILDS